MMTTQVNAVIACCAIHNFIRDEHPDYAYFVILDKMELDVNGAIPPYSGIQLLHVDP